MARESAHKRLNTPEIIDIDAETGKPFDEEFDTSSLESDQDKLLDDIIGEFGAADNEVSYKASITRIPTGFQRGQKEPWLFECDASQIVGIRTTLRDSYRGGNFRIRVYRTTGKGTKLYRQMDYSIEPPANTTQSSSDPKYDALAGALERTQNQLLALTERLGNANQIAPPAPIDPFIMMERMSTIMKNMMPPAVAPAAGGSDLDTFLKAAEFVEQIKGDSGGSGDDGIAGIVKALISSPHAGEMISAITAGRGGQRQMQRRPMLANPQNQMRQTPAQNFQPVQDDVPPPTNGNDPHSLGDQLQKNIRYLIGKAEKNADPGLYAEWLLDNTARDIIVPMMRNPGTLNQLQVAFPRLAAHRPWFDELVASANEMIDGNSKEEEQVNWWEHTDDARAASRTNDDAGGNGGNQGDAQTHVPLGEGSAPRSSNAGVDSIPGT